MSSHSLNFEDFSKRLEALVLFSINVNGGDVPFEDFDIEGMKFILSYQDSTFILLFKDNIDLIITSANSYTIGKQAFGDNLENNVFNTFMFNEEFSTDYDLVVNIYYFIYTKFKLGNSVSSSIVKLSKLFSLSSPPDRKLIGLIGELLFILSIDSKDDLVGIWHSAFSDRFDFSSEGKLYEVKTTTGYKRIHSISSSQLESKSLAKVVSVQLLVTESGSNIYDIIDILKNELNSKNFSKVVDIVGNVLGNSEFYAKSFTFDYKLALESIRIYDLPPIELLDLYNFLHSYDLQINFASFPFTLN